jgi:outer membrane protein
VITAPQHRDVGFSKHLPRVARCRAPAGVTCVIPLLCVVGSVAAETLQDAWQTALAVDWTLKAAQSREESASAQHDAARGDLYPTVSVGAGVTRWRDTPAFDFSAAGLPGELPLFDGRSLRTSDARVSLPLYSGGRIRSTIDAADATLTARQRATSTTTQDIKIATAERYVAVLRAASAVTIVDASQASLAAHTRDVDDMFQNGQVPKNDLLAASVSLADAEQQQLQARNALELAKAAYNRRLDRPLGEPVTLDPSLPPLDSQLEAATLEELVAMADMTRDELASLAATRDALIAQSSAARAAARPQLALAGGYTMLENDFLNREDFWSLGITVQWNLLDGGRSRNTAAAFAAEAAAVAREQADLRSLIEYAVHEASLNVRESRQRIGVAENAITQAEENLRVVRDRYLQGEGTNTEVLDAEALLATSRGNFDNARFDAALAELRLARAVGVL